jgi:hypothetical protein
VALAHPPYAALAAATAAVMLPDTEQRLRPGFDAQSLLMSLRGADRAVDEERLRTMKQRELGAVFVEAGGPSSDKKKPKVWLVDQILWRVFDFERGHEAIRGRGVDYK